MTFGYALLFGVVGSIFVTIIIAFWANKFKLKISGKIIVLSWPFLGVAITAFILLASEKVLVIALLASTAIAILTSTANLIWNLIDKWKS